MRMLRGGYTATACLPGSPYAVHSSRSVALVRARSLEFRSRRGAQEQVIRSQLGVVAVDVRVSDSDDRFGSDLTADDFESYEDGMRQDAQVVYRVSQARGQHVARSIEPLRSGMAAQAGTGSAPRGRQTWIFFFDAII